MSPFWFSHLKCLKSDWMSRLIFPTHPNFILFEALLLLLVRDKIKLHKRALFPNFQVNFVGEHALLELNTLKFLISFNFQDWSKLLVHFITFELKLCIQLYIDVTIGQGPVSGCPLDSSVRLLYHSFGR